MQRKTKYHILFKISTSAGVIVLLIIYMKILCDSDWSRAVQLLFNFVQKCVTPSRNV